MALHLFVKPAFMNAHQVLNSSILDIVFEGRNKEYGAYLLRKDYKKRLVIAMSVTGLAVICLVIILSFEKPDYSFIPECPSVSIPIQLINEPLPPELPVIKIPELKPPPPAFNSVQFTTPPSIVKDEKVTKSEMPPDLSEVDKVKIDLLTQQGKNLGDEMTPPPGHSTGVIDGMEDRRNTEDSIFVPIQIEATYPGGEAAWRRFLQKTFLYPQEAIDNGTEGNVMVDFIVDITGQISNIEAISGPEDLKNEAVRVIRKSGKWNPAIQNGRTVRSYKKQVVVFQLNKE